MKKIAYAAAAWLASLVFIYASGAFVVMDLNPANWTQFHREGVVIFAIFMGVISAGFGEIAGGGA